MDDFATNPVCIAFKCFLLCAATTFEAIYQADRDDPNNARMHQLLQQATDLISPRAAIPIMGMAVENLPKK